MNIVFFTSRFESIGGVEKVVQSLVSGISGNLSVITTFSPSTQKTGFRKFFEYFRVFDEVSNANISEYRVWMGIPSSILGIASYPYRLVFSLIKLVSIFQKIKPQLVNYHFPDDTMPFFYILQKLFKFKSIINIHGNDLHIFSKKPYYSWLFRQIINNSQKIIVNSEYMKSDLIKKHPTTSEKVVIIPNGIDCNSISSIKPKKLLNDDYIIFVGRLVEKKGVDILINAFSEISKKYTNLKLIIEGQGESYDELISLCSRLNLLEKIVFTKGSLSDQEKFSAIKGAILGVVPSRVEPFGIVALEFMASGVPLITSNSGGLDLIIKDGVNGLKFINGDVNQLVEKIELLLNDKVLAEKISKEGISESRKYDVREVINTYQSIFDKEQS